MARKYPTPEKATEKYITQVERNTETWVEGCREGAEDLGEWFKHALPRVYAAVTTLPEKTADPAENVRRRSAPIASLMHRLGKEYRTKKLRKLIEVARAAAAAVA